MLRSTAVFIAIAVCSYGCSTTQNNNRTGNESKKIFEVRQDKATGSISVVTPDGKPVLTQIAKQDERPYIHPIIAPDGNGVLTEYRPEHHPHQTGIYWGLKLVNGRDYFMKWQNDYWRHVSATVITYKGPKVKWETVYNLIDEKGSTTLTETANWSLQEQNGRYYLDLEWKGEAKTNITFGKFYVGGLFLRMPWHKDTKAEIVNAVGQRNAEIEAQRAIWADVGVEVEGRNDWGHMAVFDHPDNNGFPIPWRTDTQFGLGPSRQILGDWKLDKGQTEIVRYRIVIYTGKMDSSELTGLWKQFVCDR
jgi:hypothetical protein